MLFIEIISIQLDKMTMTSKITLSTTAIATWYSTRYSDFLLLLDSNLTRSQKPLLAGAWSLHNQSDIGFSILATFFRMHLDMNHLDNHHWSIHVTMTNIILLSMLVHLRYAMPNPDHPPPTQGWILPFPPSAPPQGSLDSHKNCLKIGMIPLFVILKQIFGM